MKINLDIIEDDLKSTGAIAYTKSGLTLNVDRFELFLLASNLSSNTAYLIDANAITLNHTLLSVENWICCGTPSPEIIELIPGNLLILPNHKADASTLLELETILNKYISWSAELNTAALQKEPYEYTLAPMVLKILGNPFLLFNAEDKGVVLTGEIPENAVDKKTAETLKEIKYGTPGAVLSFSKEYEIESLPLLFEKKDSTPYLITNIYVDGERYGKIVHFRINKPFTKGYRSLANYFCQFMGTLTKNGLTTGAIGNKESTFLIELISKQHVSKIWLYNQVRENGWDNETGFRMIMTDGRHEPLSNSQKTSIREQFSHAFPDGTIFEFKNRIACFLASSSVQIRSDSRIKKRINSAFHNDQLIFGVSMVFPDISRLRYYTNQCQHLLDNFNEYSFLKDIPNEHIFFYDSDFFFFDFFKTYGIDVDYRWIIHPGVEKLALYDNENNTDNVKFLETYIETGCSSKATAAILFIHQNTVLYRIERIKEICKIDIKDYDRTASQLFHILISCKTVLFDKMKKAHY